jgi:hypothetical protein
MQELQDYKTLYTVYEQMPSFFEKGGSNTSTALLDYFGGIAFAPSTYLSLLIPAGGKVAGQAAVATSKLATGKILSGIASRPLTSAAVIEGTGGALQDIAHQGTMIEAGLQKNYSFGQTALATAISAGASVGVPLVMGKKEIVKRIEKDTGDIVKESETAILKRRQEADINANSILDKNKELGQQVTDKLNSLNKDAVEAGKAKLGEMASTKGLDASIRLAVQPEKFKQVSGFLTDVLAQAGGLKDGERITEGLQRVVKLLGTEEEAVKGIKGATKATEEVNKAFSDILKKYDLTYDDIGNIFMADLSDAARVLQAAGQSKKALLSKLRRFNGALDDVANYDMFGVAIEQKEAIKKLAEAANDGNVSEYLKVVGGNTFMDKAKAVDAMRLAFMTSQFATTFRNTISGAVRLPMDALTRAFDTNLARVTGTKVLKPNSDAFAIVYGMMNKKEAALIEQIFENGFQNKASTLFRQLADISDGLPNGRGGNHKVGKMERVSRQLNALNTISDNLFKRAAFAGNLKRSLNDLYTYYAKNPSLYKKEFGKELAEEDFNLIEIIKKGRFNDVFGTKGGKEALDKVIQDTLYFTYQKTPDMSTSAGRLGNLLIQGAHSAPFLGTAIVPFPRFMVNAMRFTYEYSPAYLLASSKARGQLLNVGKSLVGMKPNELITSYEDAAKGLVGTAGLVAATAFRLTDHAGENWYEGVTEEGRSFDLRPMFPAAPFLFFGDILANLIKGEPAFKNRDFFTSAIQALTGSQFKAGFGLYSLEKAFDDLTNEDIDPTQRFYNLGAEYFGNLFSTLTIPATAVQDIDNTFLAPDDERVLKAINKNDALSVLINKTLSRLPRSYSLQTTLEDLIGESTGYKAPKPRQYSFKEGKTRRVAPLTRQTAGILLNQKKNKFESELDRLKIRKYAKYPTTGVPEYDEMYGVIMDHYIKNVFVPYINSDAYQNLEDTEILKRDPDGGTSKVFYPKAEKQRDLLQNMITEVKNEVALGIKSQRTRENYAKKYKNYPKDVLDFNRLPSRVRSLAFVAYDNTFKPPASKNDYDYNKLLSLGKEIAKRFPDKIEFK